MKRYFKFVERQGKGDCDICDFEPIGCGSFDFRCSDGYLKEIKNPTPEQINRGRIIKKI